MAITVPAAEDVQALYEFIMQRAEEEHAATIGDEALDPDAMAHFWRISNSNKLAITGAAESLGILLSRGELEQAERTWHLLTAAGEQWLNHPDHLPAWENSQAASVRQMLAGG
ncbi:hypothetical protein ABZX98_13425 [Streptomyces sp. NPDC002992]|uniref:hypothetical protein n=1 Tax=Streptomyces sp. NPDC002992 TaxID=3154273 RepID=UPI0033BEA56B